MKSLFHPVLRILGIAAAITIGLRALFFQIAPWLWAQESPLDRDALTPWTRWTVMERDGLEPYALLILVVVACAATAWLSSLADKRVPERMRIAVAALAPLALLVLAYDVPLRPPLAVVATTTGLAILVVGASLLATALVARSVRGDCGVPAWVALLVAVLCFLPTTLLSRYDAQTIFLPALNLLHGVSLRHIYFQYDLLLSLLALLWLKIGANPMTFFLVDGLGYLLFFLGLFLTARRWSLRAPVLAALLVCVVLVRVYGCLLDATAIPQVTPWRLDLWIVPLALTLVFGLDHCLVGLALALLCFFCRSFAVLYLGAFALAWTVDFIAARSAASEKPQPFWTALRAAVRRVSPGLGLVVLSLVLGRLVFGSLTSEAAALYRQLGLGMLRIARGSFYWWLLPLNATVVGLVFFRRASLPVKQRQAALFLCTLAIANSIYFFGRSHESNLVNLSAIFLLLFFLAIDLGWGLPETNEAPLMRRLLRLLPWCAVAFCAYFYAGQVVKKVDTQAAVVANQQDLKLAAAIDVVPIVDCREIARAIDNIKLVYFSCNDFWFYWQCANRPVGRYQPMLLAPLKEPLLRELDRFLNEGYKIVVPKQAKDWSHAFERDFLPALPGLSLAETGKYLIYRRP